MAISFRFFLHSVAISLCRMDASLLEFFHRQLPTKHFSTNTNSKKKKSRASPLVCVQSEIPFQRQLSESLNRLRRQPILARNRHAPLAPRNTTSFIFPYLATPAVIPGVDGYGSTNGLSRVHPHDVSVSDVYESESDFDRLELLKVHSVERSSNESTKA